MIRLFISGILLATLISGCGLKADLRLPPAPPPPATTPNPAGVQK